MIVFVELYATANAICVVSAAALLERKNLLVTLRVFTFVNEFVVKSSNVDSISVKILVTLVTVHVACNLHLTKLPVSVVKPFFTLLSNVAHFYLLVHSLALENIVVSTL